MNNSSTRPVNKTFLREALSGIERRMRRQTFALNELFSEPIYRRCKFDKPSRSIRRYRRSRRRQGLSSLLRIINISRIPKSTALSAIAPLKLTAVTSKLKMCEERFPSQRDRIFIEHLHLGEKPSTPGDPCRDSNPFAIAVT